MLSFSPPGRSPSVCTDSAVASARPEHPTRQVSPAVPSNRVSWGLIVGLLVFGPFAFGAVEFWATAIVELLALGVAASWIAYGIYRGELRVQINPLLWAVIGLQSWILLQILLGWTVDPSATRDALLLLFCYSLVFVAVSNESWSARWMRRLALAIALIGFAVAFFGIIQFFSWNGRLYWVRPVQAGAPFGPYVNRNHFAGLIEMTFLVTFSLLFSKAIRSTLKGVLAFFAVVMTLALFMSLSRAGILSLALAVIAFVCLFSRREGRRPVMVALGLLAALSVGWLVWMGAEPLLQRVVNLRGLNQEASYLDRVLMARDTLRIVRENPYVGTGPGTFPLVYPIYATWYTKLRVSKAHNDYLQLLSEVGLVGFGFAVVWVVGLFRSVVGAVRKGAGHFSPLRLGALCGCLAILIHSLFDFNLQIPANAMYFTVLAALATREDSAAARQARGQPLSA